MALYFDLSKVADWENKQKKYSAELEILIYASLTIGMGDLNRKTLKEFCYRLNRYSQEIGAIALTKDHQTLIWTEELLERWLGLHTNAATISNPAFDKILRERSGRAKERY